MSKSAPIGSFERYLSWWVALCIAAGVGLGSALPWLFQTLARLEYGSVNFVVAVLIPSTIFGLQIGAAIIFHEGSTLIVVANALRLLAYRGSAA